MSKKSAIIFGFSIGIILIIYLSIVRWNSAQERIEQKKDETNLEQIENSRIADSVSKAEKEAFELFIGSPKIEPTYTNPNLQSSFASFRFTNEFVFDRYSLLYSTRWFYRQSERGTKYLISVATISSKIKDPVLPGIYAYYVDSFGIFLINSFKYEFYYWSDYGTYLGNYHDTGNDFAYTETIRFDLGAVINEEYIQYPILILASKIGRFSRVSKYLGNPPVEYKSTVVAPYKLSALELANDFQIISILNQGKLLPIKEKLNSGKK